CVAFFESVMIIGRKRLYLVSNISQLIAFISLFHLQTRGSSLYIAGALEPCASRKGSPLGIRYDLRPQTPLFFFAYIAVNRVYLTLELHSVGKECKSRQ